MEKIMIYYTKDNIRIETSGRCALLFLTKEGIEKYGKIGFINMSDEGDEISTGEPFGDAEAAKGVFDLVSPVNGTVTRVNYKVLESPDSITENDFIIEAEFDSITEDVMNEAEYKAYSGSDDAKFTPKREMKL